MKRIIAALAALALVAGGVAYATIPDHNGVIHGCYANKTPYTLKVIDSEKSFEEEIGEEAKCPSGTTSLNWNQTGPKGATGPTGAEGPAGPGVISHQDVNHKNCEIPTEGHLFCFESSLTFTPSRSGVCDVTVDATIFPGGANTLLGIAVRKGSEDQQDGSDSHGFGSPYYGSGVSRTRAIAVTAGVATTFEPEFWTQSAEVERRGYWEMSDICFGT